MLPVEEGLTQREVAAVLGMRSGSPVAFQHQRLAARLKADRTPCRQVAAIENRLASQPPRYLLSVGPSLILAVRQMRRFTGQRLLLLCAQLYLQWT